MDNSVAQQLADKLRSLGKPEEKIALFLDRLTRHLAIQEASAPANIPRNVPVNKDSIGYHQLKRLIKHSNTLSNTLENLDKELKTRLQFTAHELQSIHEAINTLHQRSQDILRYQTAMSDEHKVPHLRPEYKGRNPTPSPTIEQLVILKGALDTYFPDIRPARNQTEEHHFFALAGILLDKKDPRRVINRMIEILANDI